jgi:type III secretion protein L
LFNGKELHLATDSKIIPSDTIAKVLDASEILNQVKEDALKYRQKITEECEHIKENAFQEGYQEGYKQWAEHLAEFENKLAAMQQELQKLIIPIALKAAKKIVGREIELSEDAIVDIVSSNLKSVAQHKKITVYVNKKQLEVLENYKPRLRELFEHLESLSIRPRDDVEEGGCMIETEVGIINAQMDHRWKVLEKAFEAMMKSSPENL